MHRNRLRMSPMCGQSGPENRSGIGATSIGDQQDHNVYNLTRNPKWSRVILNDDALSYTITSKRTNPL